MKNQDFNKIVLKRKKDKVIQTICLACEYCNLTTPTINFDGCPLEGVNGAELAHYHTGGVNKICVSEKQLEIQSLNELESTSIHEVIHHLGLMHGSAGEKGKFEQIKNYVRSRVWRPEIGGSQFLSADEINEANKRIRQDPERLARINEDSDYVKFLEGRSLDNKKEITGSNLEKPKRPHKVEGRNLRKKALNRTKRTVKESKKKEKITKSRIKTIYKPMGKKEIEESRKKLGISIDQASVNRKIEITPEPKNVLTDDEQEQLTNNAYADMDTGFGDTHGENRWEKSKKREGIFRRILNALGFK